MDEIKQPWLRGIIDSLTAANLIRQSKIEHKNRLIVILLDSALEIAFRNFLIKIKKIKLTEAHKHRECLLKVAKANTSFNSDVWESIDYYYEDIRCELYHSSSDKTLTERSLDEYVELVEFVIDSLFNIKSRNYILPPMEVIQLGKTDSDDGPIYVSDLKTDLELFLFAISKFNPSSLTELNDHLRREGVRKKFEWKQFNNCVSANYKHLFYYNKDTKKWNLSSEGIRKFKEIKERIKATEGYHA